MIRCCCRPESAYVADLGASGVYVHASDDAHDVAPVADAAVHASCQKTKLSPTPPQQEQRQRQPSVASSSSSSSSSGAGKPKHKVAFLMSDGDDVLWMFDNFATDPTHWSVSWVAGHGLRHACSFMETHVAMLCELRRAYRRRPWGVRA